MTQFSSIELMEEHVGHETYLFSHIKPGDSTIFGRWKFTVTQAAIDCDCGKAMFCPYVTQERV